jgi:hypothetical protein
MKTGLIFIIIGLVLMLALPPIGGLLIGLNVLIFLCGMIGKTMRLLAKGAVKGARSSRGPFAALSPGLPTTR